jgi:hypothetical protein
MLAAPETLVRIVKGNRPPLLIAADTFFISHRLPIGTRLVFHRLRNAGAPNVRHCDAPRIVNHNQGHWAAAVAGPGGSDRVDEEDVHARVLVVLREHGG